MGGCFSSKPSSFVCKNIRVVQLNGYVEDFDYPVSVSEVTAKLPEHFVCTHSQLLSTCSKPLMANAFLEPGQIYFLLPFSFFESNFSLVDLVPIARKLTNIAKSSRSNVKSVDANLSCVSPVWKPQASGLQRFSDIQVRMETEYALQSSSPSRSWKPILPTIRERSFNRRSESDLQEKSMEAIEYRVFSGIGAEKFSRDLAIVEMD